MWGILLKSPLYLLINALVAAILKEMVKPVIELMRAGEHAPPVPIDDWLAAAVDQWLLLAILGTCVLVIGRAVVESEYGRRAV